MSGFFKYLVVLSLLMIVSCSTESLKVSVDDNKTVVIETSDMEIIFDTNMYSTISMKKDGKKLSLNKSSEAAKDRLPNFYTVTEKGVAKNYKLDFNTIKIDSINNELGIGKKITISGKSEDITDVSMQKIVTVEVYDQFPSTAIMYAQFINSSAKNSIQLNEVYSSCYQLDASNVNKNSDKYGFYSFFGTEGRIYKQKEKPLSANLNLENYTGRSDSLEGIKRGNGGIPIVDLWCKEAGLGIGHIEKKWQNLYLPIRVQKNGKVLIAVREIPNINLSEPLVLKPGESFNTVKTFVNVHTLDFYNTLRTYANIMKKRGLDFSTEASETDYTAAWCSWNEYSTHAMASKKDVMVIEPILKRLPDLKKMHIGEVIFDAGWFNNQGDWMPNTDPHTFPKGEEDIIKAIAEIHKAGLKVELWISYLTADPWSEVSKKHPEWMIKKRDGSFHLDRWSGYTMCPSLPEVQEYHKQLAKRLVEKYGADGFKVDGMYVCPPCYNPSHHHKNPNESSQDFDKVFKSFYDGARSTKKSTTVMLCPCGSIVSYNTLAYASQTISSDPTSLETVRRRAKMYRALKGDTSPYSSDFIDLDVGNLHFPVSLVNAIGCGAVPQSFYGKSPSDSVMNIYRKLFAVYSEEMISKAEYLNLYDMSFDKPETHVFRKKQDNRNVFYYSFFADDTTWSGKVEFKGLDNTKNYEVFDYINNKDIGELSGHSPYMNLAFKKYLLVKCIEK